MSFLRNLSKVLVNKQVISRPLFLAHSRQQQASIDNEQSDGGNWVDEDPKDRSIEIDVETSIRYMNSKAYKETYGNDFVWTLYRRNQTNHFLSETRKQCIRGKKISTASPCPVCRDMYLVLHHRNIKLLEQFISPYSGEILPSIKTGLCQKQQQKLLISVMRAKEYGIISFYIPHMQYDYEYYKQLSKKFLEENKSSKQS